MPAPWERREEEGSEAWAAFVCYRDMGPARSIPKVYQECTKSQSLLKRWSSEHKWEVRVRAWEEELDRIRRNAQAQAIFEMRERHVQIAVVAQNKIVQRLQNMDAEKLTPRDLMYWLVEATKLERISRGEAGDRLRLDFQNMSDEDLLACILGNLSDADPEE